MYEKSCEMIYEMIAARIRTKRDLLGLRNQDIYPDDDNMLCAIAMNRRHEKKNKYLIPGDTDRTGEPKMYAQIISRNLQFASPKELLWGDYYEIEAYAGALFLQIILDALECESEEVCHQIYKALVDYIPFAVAKFYIETIEKHPDIAKYLIDTKYHADESDFIIERELAISRLYKKIKFNFEGLLSDLYLDRNDTYKLNKRISELVVKKLVPLISNTLSDDSVGKDAYRIMTHRHDRMIKLFNYELALSPEAMGYHENETDYEERKIMGDVVKEDANYVDSLAKIQAKSEESLSISVLENKWSPEMCI